MNGEKEEVICISVAGVLARSCARWGCILVHFEGTRSASEAENERNERRHKANTSPAKTTRVIILPAKVKTRQLPHNAPHLAKQSREGVEDKHNSLKVARSESVAPLL
ncbi:hypothetical protein TRVL_06929 [Trypanosoma vivax]|nr:hypothetical protein TRVL_06929 [Trypanosoma vivax]